jgi:predicted enzyme related to lactoylglutathione lyase
VTALSNATDLRAISSRGLLLAHKGTFTDRAYRYARSVSLSGSFGRAGFRSATVQRFQIRRLRSKLRRAFIGFLGKRLALLHPGPQGPFRLSTPLDHRFSSPAGTGAACGAFQNRIHAETSMIVNSLAGIAVGNLDAAISWYERLLGRAADSRPMPEVAEWKFDKGGWIQVFADANRRGRSSVTLVVDDMDAQLHSLKEKKIDIGATSSGETVKTAIVKDPDGNQIVFAQGFDRAHLSSSS